MALRARPARLPLLLLALGLALAPAPGALGREASVSKCIWRNEVVCDASPGYVIAKMSTLAASPAESPLAVAVLQAAAMEAACHVFDSEADCAAAGGCAWDNTQAPSCNVDAALLAQRDVFKSGCPGSLMAAYVHCGSAFNQKACGRKGDHCVWYDELEPASKAGAPSRRLSEASLPGAVPATAPRACMPKQLYALERKHDKEGTKRVMKQIASQDPAAWGDCPGVAAMRAMSKLCTSFSSPGTCKASAPICRWNDLVRACVTTGAGQAGWVLGGAPTNGTEIADGAKACARAGSKLACMSMDTVAVDPKLFASVQTGDFSAAAKTKSAAGSRGRAAAALAGAAAAAAVLLL